VAHDLGELPVEVTGNRSDRPRLEADELYRFYHAGRDETFALRGVSFAVGAGEMIAISGPSGSGKSTLLSCLAGLDEPDGGHVSVDGEWITRQSETERCAIRARSIGMLLQAGSLLEPLSVLDNIRVAQKILGQKDNGRALELLHAMGLMDHRDAVPSSLSGGERARAGLAVALANDPKVVLADEPTGELDASNEGVVLGLLRDLAAQGSAIVVVTHSKSVSEQCDRVIDLLDGRIVS
jgi:putative ABC transport system ATP-binding protein